MARNGICAVANAPCFEPILQNVVPGAANDHLLAIRAIGIRCIGMNVAFIHVVKPGFARDLASEVESLRRRRGFVLKFEVRVERSEVQRNIEQIGQDPIGQLCSVSAGSF